MRTSKFLLLALVVALLATSCNGDDEAAEPKPDDGTTTAGEQDPSPEPTETNVLETLVLQVWFHDGETLAVNYVTRPVSPAVGRESLDALLDGPPQGFETQVPAGTELLDLVIEDGIATADLSSEFESGGGSLSVRMRLAQLVFTLTQFPTVKGVLLELDGEPVSAFSGEGYVIDKPLRRKNFEDLSPAIIVEAPFPNESVSSPVIISGTANVFEATVSLRILGAAGNELVKSFTTATCGTGCRGRYTASLEFEVSEAQQGTIEVFESSAEDGSAIHVVAIPVTLVP